MKSERYSRFTLQPAEDGERHAEVKLSDDAIDDSADVEAHGSPSFRPAPLRQNRCTLVYTVAGLLLIFLGGWFHLLSSSLFFINVTSSDMSVLRNTSFHYRLTFQLVLGFKNSGECQK